MINHDKMMQHVRSHPFSLVFATISGAHLYGFPSPNSDFDLHGMHLLPLETVVGLDEGKQTVEKEGIYDGLEIDLVTHEAAKFFGLTKNSRRSPATAPPANMPITTWLSQQRSGNCSPKNHRHESNRFSTCTASC